MPKPRRRLVEVNARWEFLVRMYYATGIHTYKSSKGHVVERYAPNIQLYSVERLQDILFGSWDIPFSDYRFYFKSNVLSDYTVSIVSLAHSYRVTDWVGIP
ncbi:MAG: hypothetical protein QXP58_07040 [Thermoprotei archaeon]